MLTTFAENVFEGLSGWAAVEAAGDAGIAGTAMLELGVATCKDLADLDDTKCSTQAPAIEPAMK
jgi:hypothetical protein